MIPLRPNLYSFARSFFALLLFTTGCVRDKTADGSSPTAPRQYLYVTVAQPPTLLVFPGGASGDQTPLTVIKENSPDRPIDCATNMIGEVYVANQNGNVRVYGAGRDQQYNRIRSYEGSHTRLDHPVAIAVNKAGSFYVADTADGHGRVEWFSGGANEDILPDKVLEGPHTGIKVPSGVAIDGSGRTFVADRSSNRIMVFDPNARDDATPLAVIDGVHSPGRIAVDDLLNVYVVNTSDNSIMVFDSNGPESWTAAPPITNKSLQSTAAVAIDPTGQIAVGAIGGIAFFAGDAHGDSDPIVSLLGSPSPLNPSGVCFH
jgi:DNA-binding beta-propeller fold protein YncE